MTMILIQGFLLVVAQWGMSVQVEDIAYTERTEAERHGAFVARVGILSKSSNKV